MARVLSTKNERISFLLGSAATLSVLFVLLAIRGSTLLLSSRHHATTTFDIVCEVAAIVIFSVIVTALIMIVIAVVCMWVSEGTSGTPTETTTAGDSTQAPSETASPAPTVTEILNEDLATKRGNAQ